ncbi:uncharacterized protein LOC124360628 isoform X2 [Homalodisca vitripennis]|uniref:uncharacterized protein LOC124360628 isoform X2 n=1 Tax=Homalodisca vitripennis TaxID=197043 RepID=UPI001EECA8C8|nr:uncharacterized protein LOC124360628 isoform X2 [Homalodisca vitripennis]
MTGEQLRRIMWGRASISTPQKISKKMPVSNPLADLLTDVVPPPEDKPAPAPSLGGGFGDALTAALDVIAFTNDLDISGPSPYSTENGPLAEDPFLELFLSSEQETLDVAHLTALAEAAVAASITEPKQEMPVPDPVLLAAKANLEQISNLEPSDSDGLGDGPLLGRGSRVKRARSAHQRVALQSSDKQQLFRRNNGGDSSSNTSSLDYELSTPASLLRLTSPPTGKPIKAPRPKEVTKARPRPKTARVNRVAPACDVPNRRGASATSAVSPPPPQSPPDPLEPWSTRGITNMNTILAWPQSDHDSL